MTLALDDDVMVGGNKRKEKSHNFSREIIWKMCMLFFPSEPTTATLPHDFSSALLRAEHSSTLRKLLKMEEKNEMSWHKRSIRRLSSALHLQFQFLAAFAVFCAFRSSASVGDGFSLVVYFFLCSLLLLQHRTHGENACCMSERGEDKSGFTNKSFFNKKVERLNSVLCVCKRGRD